jgi:hypothetical protein
MHEFYVYQYLRSNNSEHGAVGSPYYVGKGRDHRAWDKDHRVKPPSDLANIVMVAENMSEPDAFQLEMLLIHTHGRIDNRTGCLANLTDGGQGQHGVHKPHTEEWKQWMKEHPNSGQFKPGHKLGWFGKKRTITDAHRRNLRIANLGRIVSEETRAKIGASHKGSKRSEEVRAKLSAIHTGLPWSEKRKAAFVKATHCRHGHEFTPENTRLKRRSENGNKYVVRICKECTRACKERVKRHAALPQLG